MSIVDEINKDLAELGEAGGETIEEAMDKLGDEIVKTKGEADANKLPEVTAEDEGKVLTVDSEGKWGADTPSSGGGDNDIIINATVTNGEVTNMGLYNPLTLEFNTTIADIIATLGDVITPLNFHKLKLIVDGGKSYLVFNCKHAEFDDITNKLEYVEMNCVVLSRDSDDYYCNTLHNIELRSTDSSNSVTTDVVAAKLTN